MRVSKFSSSIWPWHMHRLVKTVLEFVSAAKTLPVLSCWLPLHQCA